MFKLNRFKYTYLVGNGSDTIHLEGEPFDPQEEDLDIEELAHDEMSDLQEHTGHYIVRLKNGEVAVIPDSFRNTTVVICERCR